MTFAQIKARLDKLAAVLGIKFDDKESAGPANATAAGTEAAEAGTNNVNKTSDRTADASATNKTAPEPAPELANFLTQLATAEAKATETANANATLTAENSRLKTEAKEKDATIANLNAEKTRLENEWKNPANKAAAGAAQIAAAQGATEPVPIKAGAENPGATKPETSAMTGFRKAQAAFEAQLDKVRA